MQRQQFRKRRFVAKLAPQHERLLIDLLRVAGHVFCIYTVAGGRQKVQIPCIFL